MKFGKKAMAVELREDVADAVYVLFTDYRGLNVSQTEDLRRRLDEIDARFRIVKNRIFKHVARELSYDGLEPSLAGPNAMVVGNGDVVEAAKVLKAFVKENELPIVKIGVLDGVILSAGDIKRLADLPPRDVLLGTLVGTIAAPMTQLIGVCRQKVGSLINVLKAIESKKEEN